MHKIYHTNVLEPENNLQKKYNRKRGRKNETDERKDSN